MNRFLKALPIFVGLLILEGCEVPRGTLPDSVKELNHRLNIALQAMLGNYEVPAGRPPIPVNGAGKPNGATQAGPTPEQEKNQLLHEMFQVVLLREPGTNGEFAGYLNALIQGASLEGIYNGFVNSDYYKSIEERGAAANPATVHVFALVISTFQHELSEMKSSSVKMTDLGVVAPYQAGTYEKFFSNDSLYKLKRILAAEALKVIAAKREATTPQEPEKMGHWYASFAALMAGQGVDFGLSLRNRPDYEFHLQWYKSLKPDVVVDRVTWEVLNRVHRLLNATERRVTSVAPIAGNSPVNVSSNSTAPTPAASPVALKGKKGDQNWEILSE